MNSVTARRLCWTCSAAIVPCGCHGHSGPMWKHKATGRHRCGPDGNALAFASPSPPACDCDGVGDGKPGIDHRQGCEMYGRAVTS